MSVFLLNWNVVQDLSWGCALLASPDHWPATTNRTPVIKVSHFSFRSIDSYNEVWNRISLTNFHCLNNRPQRPKYWYFPRHKFHDFNSAIALPRRNKCLFIDDVVSLDRVALSVMKRARKRQFFILNWTGRFRKSNSSRHQFRLQGAMPAD